MYKDVCEATNVRGEQSDEVMDVRMSCLRDRWRELRALSDVLVEGQAGAVTNAIGAATALTPIDRCSEVGTVRAGVAPPPDAVRKRVEALRNRLVNVKALEDSSNFGRALETTAEIVTEARDIGYRPVIAEALNRLGRMQAGTGQAAKADANLEEAVWIAEAAGDDEVVAEATTEQIYVSGYLQRDPARARRWTSHAQAVLDRLGGHDQLRAWMLNNTGVVLDADGQHQEAATRFFQALRIKEHVLGKDHPDVGYTLGNLADTLNALGRPLEALELSNRGVDIILRTFGPGHPDMALQLVNRAEILNQLGRYEEARRDAESAVAIDEHEMGNELRTLVFALAPLAEAELGLGHPERALPPLERALERAETSGLDAELPRLRFALARALWDTDGDRDRARELVDAVVSAKPTPGTVPDAREEQLLRRAKAWLASRPRSPAPRRR
jgi:serine/threonine-protein kinase